jgi:drug/metabolite transporter (DMT)-like permease
MVRGVDAAHHHRGDAGMTATAIGVLLVVVSTMVEGFGQVFLKKSALESLRRRFWILLGVSVLIVEVLLYSGALHFLAVSTAFPLTSLSFVMVTVLSRWLLGEVITPKRWIGVGLILIGTTLIVAHA